MSESLSFSPISESEKARAILLVGRAVQQLRHPKRQISRGARVHPYRIIKTSTGTEREERKDSDIETCIWWSTKQHLYHLHPLAQAWWPSGITNYLSILYGTLIDVSRCLLGSEWVDHEVFASSSRISLSSLSRSACRSRINVSDS